MSGRFIALGLAGLLFASPLIAQEPSSGHRFRLHLRPKVSLEHRQAMRIHRGEMKLRLRHHAPLMRAHLRMHRPAFKMRDFQLRLRPRVRLERGTAEI